MRAHRPIGSSSLVVVALALVAGCKTGDAPQSASRPEPSRIARLTGPVPDLPPRPRPDLPRELPDDSGGAESVRAGPSLDDLVPQAVQGLVFQCTDRVTFAVRMQGRDKLEVYPPGFTLGFIVLTQQPTHSGVLYTRRGAEFRSNGEIGSLNLGSDERYVDCVSNPAATLWGARAGTAR